MKDIKVKQTNLILEKNIEKPTFLYECILENINTKKLIKGIEHGITLPSNMNHRTNVRGEMTDWKYFVHDVDLNSLLSFCIDHFNLDSKMGNSYLVNAWGNKMTRNCFTALHDHTGNTVSGVLFLNTCKGHYLEFPELDLKTEVIENKIVLFRGHTRHKAKRITDNTIKYAIAFNFRARESWE